MTVFIVNYDLRRPGQNYKTLYDEMDRLDAHRALESFWLVNVPNTSKELHDHLKGYVDNNDRIWVSELTTQYYFSNAMAGTNAWLSKNPPAR